LPGFTARGSSFTSTRYSFGSGIPATSFMPHLGQRAGLADRTSGSIGHTNRMGLSSGFDGCARQNSAE
jgi:hypothetical protein